MACLNRKNRIIKKQILKKNEGDVLKSICRSSVIASDRRDDGGGGDLLI